MLMGCRYCITTHKTLPNTRVSTLFSVDLLSKDRQDLSIRKMFIASHTGMLCPVTFCVQDRAKQLLMMNYFLSQSHLRVLVHIITSGWHCQRGTHTQMWVSLHSTYFMFYVSLYFPPTLLRFTILCIHIHIREIDSSWCHSIYSYMKPLRQNINKFPLKHRYIKMFPAPKLNQHFMLVCVKFYSYFFPLL